MPQEHRLILKYVDQPGYTPDLESSLRHGGYEVLKKALAIRPKTPLSRGAGTGGSNRVSHLAVSGSS